jgi:hypothetical protein
MSMRSWHLDRRELLRGCGAALALPMLESMAAVTPAATARPKRLVVTYFSFGM